MGDKKSPSRPKRQAKPTADDGFWDCSVCTFKNSAEAFKCSICDVRKGTSTRKPRINSQLVAQQVAQQFALPPPAKKERRERPERGDKERGEGDHPEEHEQQERDGDQEEERDRERDADGERPDITPPRSTQQPDAEPLEKEHKEPVHKEPVHKEPIHKEPVHKEPIHKEKKDREKEKDVSISPVIPVTKKPNSKKTRPKSDSQKSPPCDRSSIQSGKSKTKSAHIISRPKLKNIDRSTAQQLAITVGNVTVIITDFKEKTRSCSTSSSTVTSSAGSEQQHQSSGSESMDKGSSRASTPKGELSVGHDESF
ncbi:RING1 and YY1-binding protein B [Engraulis encrasicolus]|uniref:RING1 and YY1-binding protein B n=1 Tax=Engraulis encrasicolus TaxID=184585 RepID=UPI002FD6131A